MLTLIKILSNALDICMYFPSLIGIRGAIYIVLLYRGGKKFLDRSCNRGKKAEYSFIPKRKKREKREEEFVVPHNAYLPVVPPSTSQ